MCTQLVRERAHYTEGLCPREAREGDTEGDGEGGGKVRSKTKRRVVMTAERRWGGESAATVDPF